MVTVIAMLTFNQSAFMHTHKLADGTVISHAHPYNKTTDSAPIKSHHHTLIDFLILENINFLFLAVIIALTIWLLTKTIAFRVALFHASDNPLINSSLGRAPPIS